MDMKELMAQEEKRKKKFVTAGRLDELLGLLQNKMDYQHAEVKRYVTSLEDKKKIRRQQRWGVFCALFGISIFVYLGTLTSNNPVSILLGLIGSTIIGIIMGTLMESAWGWLMGD